MLKDVPYKSKVNPNAIALDDPSSASGKLIALGPGSGKQLVTKLFTFSNFRKSFGFLYVICSGVLGALLTSKATTAWLLPFLTGCCAVLVITKQQNTRAIKHSLLVIFVFIIDN